MKVIKTIAILFVLSLIVAWLGVQFMTIRIPVGQVGVRVQQYGLLGDQGVVMEDFGPGWHRDLGPIDSWELFDSTVQALEMTRDPRYGSSQGVDDVKVQTLDGYAISLDVTIKYRIVAGAAHQLYKDTGSGVKYKTIIRNESQSACIGLLGQMTTEDFYNPQARRDKAAEVYTLLEEGLKDNYVEVIDVLIRSVQFDPEYESKIRQKKLSDQSVELNISISRAEKKSGERQVIEAETIKEVALVVKEQEVALIGMKAQTDLEIAGIQADAERFIKELRADADLINSQKGADGARKVAMAEAKGEKLRNDAIQGVGGSVIVALEAARNLRIDEATISTVDIDLLDINKMVEKLGLEVE
jgi:hypothetical protein